jgi:ComF family protein
MTALPDWRQILLRIEPRWALLREIFGRLLFPPHCLSCCRPVDEDEDRYLCRDCIRRIDFVHDPCCPRCGLELGPHEKDTRRCSECRNTPMRFDRAVAAAHHDGAARRLVLGLKFGGQTHNVIPLGKLLDARLNDTGVAGLVQQIVPVPLHRTRLRQRGFNQSRLIAEDLGRRMGLPVIARRLRRTLDTPPQTLAVTAADRRSNVKGAFEVARRHPFAGKTVLLVDDVLTTGATTSECAGALKRAGARVVYVATCTRRMMTPPQVGDPAPVRYRIEAVPDAQGPDESRGSL